MPSDQSDDIAALCGDAQMDLLCAPWNTSMEDGGQGVLNGREDWADMERGAKVSENGKKIINSITSSGDVNTVYDFRFLCFRWEGGRVGLDRRMPDCQCCLQRSWRRLGQCCAKATSGNLSSVPVRPHPQNSRTIGSRER